MATTPQSSFVEFFAVFFLARGTSGPAGIPLYGYQVSASELEELVAILRKFSRHVVLPTNRRLWDAAFCLFVSERFRRDYDAGPDGWAWGPFEQELRCQLTPAVRRDIVHNGLAYWKRTVRQHESGNDNLLGSLFIEGGLPWPLVKSEHHGFGRVVRRGLKNYYRAQSGLKTLAEMLDDGKDDLPQTFRTVETLELLAGIVEHLMDLATRHELQGRPDPAGYLDERDPSWRRNFPLPLDEDNARTLINEWLIDASRQRATREAQQREDGYFSCMHRLLDDGDVWWYQTDVTIPRTARFQMDPSIVNPGRLELAFFEGDRLLARAGTAYGCRDPETQEVKVRFLQTNLSLRRSNLGNRLTLRLLANGRVACLVPFDNGSFALNDAPLVFELRGDEWWFVASASCSTAASRVRVRLPQALAYVGADVRVVREEDCGPRWIEADSDLTILSANGDGGERYSVRLRDAGQSPWTLSLKGQMAYYESVPTVVHRGWPRLEVTKQPDATNPVLRQYSNRLPVTNANRSEQFGAIRYYVRNENNDILLQRRIGVVPVGFRIDSYPEVAERRARLVIRESRQLRLHVVDAEIQYETEVSGQDTILWLKPVSGQPPSFLALEVYGQSTSEPIRFKLPYPYLGARLLDAEGGTLTDRNLTINTLMGLRLAVSTTRTARTLLRFEFNSRDDRFARTYPLGFDAGTRLISLFGYLNDIQQMLGSVRNQDAYLTVQAMAEDQKLLEFYVRRYNGVANREGDGWENFYLTKPTSAHVCTDARVQAMLLTDPKQAPVPVPEITTQGVGTGRFGLPASMHDDGPWLIYPAPDSSTQFRPEVQATEVSRTDGANWKVGEIRSLHAAARAFHPVHNRNAFAGPIEAMAEDLDHSGWQYLANLKTNYHHLPLSAFEAWLALARNPSALAMAVLRLEMMDEAFCERIRDELATLWECIPLPQWPVAYGKFKAWLNTKGFSESITESVLQSRLAVLRHVVSECEELGRYLETGDARTLPRVPLESILPGWYQTLRRTHEANDRWPQDLGLHLKEWIRRQKLPAAVINLSLVDYSDAVTILPIFMAYVSAGLAKIEDLPVSEARLKFSIRLLADFDREAWYAPCHGMVVSYLLHSQKN
ncbi:STY4851/ECs_5259 family protein [Cupriavidus sp. CP313]